jgi:predicted  nucleic acid-binding Zn-ribbon protein
VTSLIDEDLLGDFGNNDQLTQETNQVNQLQNQITSLRSATVDVKNQKLTAEQTLEQLAKQKQELQAQMTQVRMAHEAQVKDLNELQEAIRVEEPEWIQTRNDFEAAQQQLTAVQQEIQQLRQKLDTSRAESEECRRRVHQIQEETASLEAQIDGLNGQVKQQNMMLDINRRQVTASEQDREQAKRNLQDAKEVQGITESARDIDLNTAPKNPISSPPRKSTTDFSIDNNDDSSSDDDVDDADADNKPNPQSASSPFGTFTPASPPSAHVPDNNNTTATSSSFFDIFSPHQEQAELQATNQAAQPDGADPVDFDAVFGDLAGIPSPDENNHNSTPSSPFDIQGSNAPGSTKKHRAPPPPPPPAAKATDTLSGDMDDFDAAFSGPLSEAKVSEGHSATPPVTKATAATKSDFDDFDDAFGVFDDNKATTTMTTTTSWPSQFGGFDFPDTTTTTTPQKTTDADEWDSIFGGSSKPAAAPKAPTQDGASFGFEDAFGATPFEAKGKSPASSSSNKVFTETSIVGDGSKVDELVKMGFEKQVAKDALERYDQDLAKATNFLLDQTN